MLISLWGFGYPMVVFLGGLQNVPRELYEAAHIDGAGAWARFRHVTLPLLSPVVFFNVVMGVIGALVAQVGEAAGAVTTAAQRLASGASDLAQRSHRQNDSSVSAANTVDAMMDKPPTTSPSSSSRAQKPSGSMS